LIGDCAGVFAADGNRLDGRGTTAKASSPSDDPI
jgi:hypothetical protein